jgi:flagellar motor switch protein FliN/FliY
MADENAAQPDPASEADELLSAASAAAEKELTDADDGENVEPLEKTEGAFVAAEATETAEAPEPVAEASDADGAQQPDDAEAAEPVASAADDLADALEAELSGGSDEADGSTDEAEVAEVAEPLDAADPTAQAEALLGALQTALDEEPSSGPAATESVATAPAAQAAGGDHLGRILSLEVPVIVKLAQCHMPIGSVLNLSPGAIIEFEKHFEEPLELMINNRPIGRGIAVKVGEKFGLKINQIAAPEDKIKSLAT